MLLRKKNPYIKLILTFIDMWIMFIISTYIELRGSDGFKNQECGHDL
jgi:hypothetical protein